jgi:hypothetical protein
MKAFSQKKPFRVRYDLPGWHSEGAIDLVGTADGRVIKVEWDQSIGTWWPLYPESARVRLHSCILPTRIETGPDGRVQCSPLFVRLYREHGPGLLRKEGKVNPKDWE